MILHEVKKYSLIHRIVNTGHFVAAKKPYFWKMKSLYSSIFSISWQRTIVHSYFGYFICIFIALLLSSKVDISEMHFTNQKYLITHFSCIWTFCKYVVSFCSVRGNEKLHFCCVWRQVGSQASIVKNRKKFLRNLTRGSVGECKWKNGKVLYLVKVRCEWAMGFEFEDFFPM